MESSAAFVVGNRIYACGSFCKIEDFETIQNNEKRSTIIDVGYNGDPIQVIFGGEGSTNMYILDSDGSISVIVDYKRDKNIYRYDLGFGIISIGANSSFFYILDTDGKIHSSEHLDRLNKNFDFKIFEQTFTTMSSSILYMLALDIYGNIWSHLPEGRGMFLSLGIKDTDNIIVNYNEMIQITKDIRFKSVYPSLDNIFAIDVDGSLYVGGKNNSFQLPIRQQEPNIKFSKVIGDFPIIRDISSMRSTSYFLTVENNLWSSGDNNVFFERSRRDPKTPPQLKFLTGNVEQVSCGENFVFIKKTDGTISSAGINTSGVLGYTDILTQYRSAPLSISEIKNVSNVKMLFNQPPYIMNTRFMKTKSSGKQ